MPEVIGFDLQYSSHALHALKSLNNSPQILGGIISDLPLPLLKIQQNHVIDQLKVVFLKPWLLAADTRYYY
jgi:hypothetical protein